LIPNNLPAKRVAAGFDTPEALAVAVDIDPDWYALMESGRVLPTHPELDRLTAALGGIKGSDIYNLGSLNLIAGQRNNEDGYTPAKMYRMLADECHVLMSRDEITWFDRDPGTGHRADVAVNMSCGPARNPNLLQDTVAVLNALGVNFIAVSGSAACCGKPYTNVDQPEAAERVNKAHADRSAAWGATVHVNWCVACQMTSTVAAERRFRRDGVEHPLREVQLLTFVAERIRELGDRVPWRRPVNTRVLAVGHSDLFGPAHLEAHDATERLLRLVPGVEVVGRLDAHADDSPCTFQGREKDWTPPAWFATQDTPEGVRAHRERLADTVNSLGADTACLSHQYCHVLWLPYSSDRLSIRHPISIVAEALGCVHPDRRLAAIRLGDPSAFVEQTRDLWQSWGISEDRALELATSLSSPTFVDPGTQCRCDGGGGGGCRESLVSVDVLSATARATPATA